MTQGAIFLGVVSVEQGEGQEGIEQVQRGIAAFRATGAELYRPYFLGLLAEAYGKVVQVEEGLLAVSEGLALSEKNEERFYEAELWRLKGTLVLQSAVRSQNKSRASLRQVKTSPKSPLPNPQSLIPNPQTETEACFHKAIEIARQQQAKSLELRAVMSLARLWQQRGKAKEVHLMLTELYGWFTEGFDTRDLQEAKALLEELSSSKRAPGRSKTAKNRHRASQ